MTTATPSFAGGIGFGTGFRINPSLTGNTNDWDPAGLISASLIAISSDGAYNLTGIQASTIQGRFIWLYNASSLTITLKHNSASSAAGNRFLMPGSADFALTTNGSVLIMYSLTDAAWLISGGVPSVVPGAVSGTGTVTAVADSAASQTLLASDANRKGFRIVNDSTVALYAKYGITASTTSFTCAIPAGGYLDENTYHGQVDGIWASDASGSARITSLT